jgi:4-aminobutyrate--pyruvate transaminase
MVQADVATLSGGKIAVKPFKGLVVRFAEEEGLIVRSLAGDTVSICPPLIIAPAEIDELFARLGRALDRTLDWAKRESLLAG